VSELFAGGDTTSGAQLLWGCLPTPADWPAAALLAVFLVVPLVLLFSAWRSWHPRAVAWAALVLLPDWLYFVVAFRGLLRYGLALVVGVGVLTCTAGALVQLYAGRSGRPAGRPR
jgi:hypothetical protein